MILGIKSWKEVFVRHLIVGLIALILVNIMFLSRPEAPFEVRIWRAFGNVSFIFLFFTLIIGPLGKIFPKFQKTIPWRRETGIWFFILALFHLIKVFEYLQLEPGMELAGFLGYVGLFWGFVLAATSSDRAVNFLGIDSWKWLHSMSYVIFYVVIGHIAYFLFWRFSGENVFAYPFLVMAFLVPFLQIVTFIKIVHSRNKQKKQIKIQTFETKIKSVNEISEKTIEVIFERPKNFKFIPGQYIQVSLEKLKEPDFKGRYRLLSLASSDQKKNEISVAYRDSDSGFKKTLKNMAVGEKVKIEGPFGDLVLPRILDEDENDSSIQNTDDNHYVFIAGGIGITPFISILRSLKDAGISRNITLIYGNRNEASATYIEELRQMNDVGFISLVETFERISEGLIKNSINDLNSKNWLVVGPPEMVSAVKNILINLKIDANKIIVESFDGYTN